jgi:hypothetical protein
MDKHSNTERPLSGTYIEFRGTPGTRNILRIIVDRFEMMDFHAAVYKLAFMKHIHPG